MTDFRVSVIVPTFARPEYLLAAVDSILGQTLPPDEVIVVADGPDARLPAELDTRRVSVLCVPHGGVATARNRGVQQAQSPWVAFLDDDDLWHPDHLRRVADYLEAHPEAAAIDAPLWTFSDDTSVNPDVVAGDLATCVRSVDPQKKLDRCDYMYINGRSFDALLELNHCAIGTTVVRRDLLLRSGGFPDGLICAEDWMMALGVARFEEWHTLDVPTAFYRLHTSNNTSVRGLENALTSLGAIADIWSTLPDPTVIHRPLRDYGPYYRFSVQGAAWLAIRQRRWKEALQAWWLGRRLLRRPQDVAYVLVPPFITWRAERLHHWASKRRIGERVPGGRPPLIVTAGRAPDPRAAPG